MSRFFLIIAVVAFSVTTFATARTPSVIACSGGTGTLEFETEGSESIVVADANSVGGENAAPTLTSQEVADILAARYPHGTWTPIPYATSTPARSQIDLNGIGVTFSLVRLVSGVRPSQMALTVQRNAIERTARVIDAGGNGSLGSCAFLSLSPRYVEGQRYLLFINHFPNQEPHISASFRLDGNELINGDELLAQANTGFLYMSPATYDRYFDGILTRMLDVQYVYLADGGVPLDQVEKAIEGVLREAARIAPPDTGSAGLAGGRR